jgi:hypothetical protein
MTGELPGKITGGGPEGIKPLKNWYIMMLTLLLSSESDPNTPPDFYDFLASQSSRLQRYHPLICPSLGLRLRIFELALIVSKEVRSQFPFRPP